MNPLKLSPLGHTWILDLDGTLLKHNGYLLDGRDSFLPGAQAFLGGIPPQDMVILLTARGEECRAATERFLAENAVRYDHLIFGAPFGERILVNDQKPSGLGTAIAVNVPRNDLAGVCFEIDDTL
ncbi:MAG: hypothetical protein AB7V55_00305 [Oscillospiraceae bacterium]